MRRLSRSSLCIALTTCLACFACDDDPRSAVDVDTNAPDATAPDTHDAAAPDSAEADTDREDTSDPTDTTDTTDTVEVPDTVGGPDVAGRFPEEVPEGFTLSDLGALATTDGETADFVFEVPEGAVTLHVVLATGAGSTVALLGAASPSGQWIVFDEPPEGQDTTDADALASGFGGGIVSPNKTIALPRATTTLIPNTPRVALEPGRWSFRAGSFDAAYDANQGAWVRTPVEREIRVGMLVRTSPVPDSGAIDLVLSFDASSDLEAATAPDDPDIAASLDLLAGALDSVGLELGAVTYRDIALESGALALRVPACNLTDDAARVFDQAPSPSPDAVHVVFLQRFTCPQFGGLYDAGDSLAAMSIGAPGTPFTTRSGILASTFAKPTYPVEWAEVLAHEVGHFLGLYHTREVRGGIVDNIADTAEDEVGAAANLMFYNVTLSTQTDLTPDQGRIVRSSPLVRPAR